MVVDSSRAELRRERAIHLFTFLKELSELRTTTIQNVADYDQVIWLADLPHEPGWFSRSWFTAAPAGVAEETWAQLPKPPQPPGPPPSPPRLVLPWLPPGAAFDADAGPPTLLPRRELPVTTAPPAADPAIAPEPLWEELADQPAVLAAWQAFLDQRWTPWAEEERRVRRMQAIYGELFTMLQRQDRLGEQYEVVLGLGLLSWRTPGPQLVRRHLLVAQASLSFNPVTGTILVGAAGNGAQIALEQEMIDAQLRPPAAVEREIERQLAEFGDDLWQPAPLGDILAAWVNATDARGHYDDGDQAPATITASPVVTLAPALILRKRTERSLIRTFTEIIAGLEAGDELPLGVVRLVDVVDDRSPLDFPDTMTPPEPTAPAEVLFPLPANAEQADIVHRLATRQGVLVQGPPGTGKSHTIANLIAHLLATGQRVLVTSHTPRALRVLKDKIPAEISALCVTLVGDDRSGLQSMEDSVHSITDRYTTWDERRSAAEIARLSRDLAAAREREASLTRQVRQGREFETTHHHLPDSDYAGSASAIARRLATESKQFTWFPGAPDPAQSLPLEPAQAVNLLALLRRLTQARLAEITTLPIERAQLMPPAVFAERVAAETAARQRVAKTQASQASSAFAALLPLTAADREQLRAGFGALRADLVALDHQPRGWVRPAATQVLSGQGGLWRQLRADTAEQLTRIKQLGPVNRQVSGTAGRERGRLRADASALKDHLDGGGNLGFGPLRPGPVRQGKYLIDEVVIDGRACATSEALGDLVAWLEIQDRLEQLRQRWQGTDPVADGPVTQQVAVFDDLLHTLNQVLALETRRQALLQTLTRLGVAFTPVWSDPASLAEAEQAADAATAAASLTAVSESFATAASAVTARPHAGPGVALLDRLQASFTSRDTGEYQAAYDWLGAAEEDAALLPVREALVRQLASVSPALVSAVLNDPADPLWDAALPHLDAAWDWARASTWLDTMQDPAAAARLAAELEAQRNLVLALTRDLAAARAWDHCFRRMTENERQHLMAWMQAMRRVGKGTGKYAAQHRRAARKAMDGCRSAIPAWIMPIYRVADTIRPGTDAFDVIIIDEASQSGPEALFLQYLGKKLVVVGDDKQISPEFVGMNREEVNALRARHITQLPHSDSLGLDNSFFDQASIRFGGRIRLREHFRCMPEIIQFSNSLAYTGEPLIPLRQYGVDRLPPVRTSLVPGGFRTGSEAKIINPPEAEAIVDQICACCADPAYADKTIGVISLQGKPQAALIDKLLKERLEPEEVIRRQLVCGDAYDFQGDERDVIFLSLVAAPPREGEKRTIGVLSSERDVRRFNVAASRARDQMWLFHSGTLSDLNPKCLRYRLLEYCLNPTVDQDELDEIELREGELHPAFDSPFEQAVYALIRERGYRVRPQVEVGAYRIDLVVEGMSGRLAVECDGERWHGPEQADADMARQRDLERCGWTFWRVRGSAFYRNPAAAMAPLWAKLAQLDIHPAAAPAPVDAPDAVAVNDAFTEEGATGTTSTAADRALTPASAHLTPTMPDSLATQAPPAANAVPPAGAAAPPENVELDPPGQHPLPPASPPPVNPPGDSMHAAPAVTETTRANADLPTAAEASAPANAGAFHLPPYVAWAGRPLPNPLDTAPDTVMAALIEIVAAEGPMLCSLAYQVYLDHAGLERLTPPLRSVLNKAIYRAVQLRRLVQEDELDEPGQLTKIVRLAGTAPSRVRGRGERSLDEIPPSELGAALHLLAAATGQSLPAASEAIAANLLLHYGLERDPGSDWQNEVIARGLAHGPMPPAMAFRQSGLDH